MSKQTETAKNSAASPPSVRMAGDERRRQLVRVAVRLFSERGFRGTTTKEIAQAAGVSEAIIFRHFSTKEELYNAIIDHKSCEDGAPNLNSAISEAIGCVVGDAITRKDDFGVFYGIGKAILDHHDDDLEFLRLLFYSALEGHQLADMFWERNVRQVYESLSGYIRERQRDGVFRDMEPMLIVRAFLGMIIHHSINNNIWDTARHLLDVSNETAAREFTEILLRGISTTPSASNGNGETAAARSRKKK